MKPLILCTLLGIGTLLAQTPQPIHESESETTAITKHGRKVQTDSNKSTTYVDKNGNVSTDSTNTQTTAKKHHGKWKQKSSTQSSTTTHPQE
jgi:hypothetical protein